MGKRPDVKKKPFDGGFVDDDIMLSLQKNTISENQRISRKRHQCIMCAILGKKDGSFSAGPDDIEWEFRID